jgi:hypothetical protein
MVIPYGIQAHHSSSFHLNVSFQAVLICDALRLFLFFKNTESLQNSDGYHKEKEKENGFFQVKTYIKPPPKHRGA